MEFDDVPEGLRDSIDQVVEHLAVLRGGGLFLSGQDGRLLLDWLEEGIPPTVIITALERAADRRRKRRVRSALRLENAVGEVRRLRTLGLQMGMGGQVPLRRNPLLFSGDQGPDELAARARREVEAVLVRPDLGPEARGEAALGIVRCFHAALWDLSAEERPALLQAAEKEIADFRALMSPEDWQRSIEEVVRDLLRQRFPMLSARAVWDRLQEA